MKKLILLAAAIVTLSIGACKKGPKDPEPGKARVSVRMTDAPGAYDAVILSVKNVIVVTSNGEYTMPVNGTPIDILRFRSGKDTLLAAADIPVGRIQQVRLVLNDTGNRVIIDGRSYDLTTPSGQTSGVKLKVNDELTAGIAYTLKLDFDAAASIVTTGSGKYILKPVIRAYTDAVSGSISGTVSPAASFPKVYAISGIDTVGTIADVSGRFYFPGMPAGTYTVRFEPLAPYAIKTVTNVAVTNGVTKDMGIVTMQ
ncbi:DUF4382 domain-containing protein [Mucilaginibacter myungsuensis]|uniref:DUF4382 domain-containing protein n=1 Tax=Mucilaginibacter myungsuensis TaxID=649104 RepID=A0A929L0J6_9SPHI|nr:DUF4382 domain-containing protein [Mucilaginibacter myungsuensis]MBE9661920.1 DUF4382 domain-containing protein [Mucilaginibacter myungsuensis]MDN3599646.1 DUF4382 domain-containing protein [Mucilaginibacter myungsuensis]